MRDELLATEENQDGYNLEVLLRKLKYEILLKAMRLAIDDLEISTSVVGKYIKILSTLDEAIKLQEDILKEMVEYFRNPSNSFSKRRKGNSVVIEKLLQSYDEGVGELFVNGHPHGLKLQMFALETGLLMRTDSGCKLTDFGRDFEGWLLKSKETILY